jgi:ABC-type Fe3+ transport system permease subunit
MSRESWAEIVAAVLRRGASSDSELQREKMAIDLGIHTLKYLVLINGGAAIGILTFYGNVLSKVNARDEFHIDKGYITTALRCFGSGVLLAIMASGFAFVGASILAANSRTSPQLVMRSLTTIIGLGSGILFAVGLFFAAASFEDVPPKPPVKTVAASVQE